MEILKFSLGRLQANCYFIVEEENCLLIDPADEASFILQELAKRKLKLAGMLATHGHFDHLMAVGEIQLSIKIPLLIFKPDFFLVKRLNSSAKYFLGYDPKIIKPGELKFIKSNELKIKNFKLKILFTPGHTPGSVCFYFTKEKAIFTGDTLFKQGIGRYDFSYSSEQELKKSLKKIRRLPGEISVYPGHGDETKISSERNNSTLIY